MTNFKPKNYPYEYGVWSEIKKICHNSDHPRYMNYGHRGIRMAPHWRSSFDNFMLDMGPHPEGTKLARHDKTDNFKAGNCYWQEKKASTFNPPTLTIGCE